VNRNAGAVRKFVSAIYATARWANAHPNETAPFLAKYGKIDLATVLAINRSRCAESWSPRMVQPALDIGYKYGFFSRHLAAADLMAKF